MRILCQNTLDRRASAADRFRVGLILALASVLCAPLAAQTTLYVDRDAASSGDGTSWAAAKKTIGEALGTNRQVWVAEGAYYESIQFSEGLRLYGGFAGNETSLDDRDLAAHTTTIDASTADAGGPADHAVRIVSVVDAVLDGFAVTGGNANGAGAAGQSGGGIYCENLVSSATIVSCTIAANSASQSGGGIYFYNCPSPYMYDCTIRNNTAAGSGGGIASANSGPVLANCVVESNSAPNAGGVDLGGSQALLSWCKILRNQAGSTAGGIKAGSGGSNLGNCLILGNSAGAAGGGLHCPAGTLTRVANCTFAGNRASTGGGVYSYDCAPVFANCVFFANSGASGGAFGLSLASPVILNCTLSENSADAAGGGIYCTADADPAINNTILHRNRNHAVHEATADSDPVPVYCVFHDNPEGDFYDEAATPYTGAAAINTNIPNAHDNLGGDPIFPLAAGVWTSNASYNPATNLTTLYDSAANYAADSLADRAIEVDAAGGVYSAVAGNTASTIDVYGNVAAAGAAGKVYRLSDFALLPGSAALDAGATTGVVYFDRDHRFRPKNLASSAYYSWLNGFDIGAVEALTTASAGLRVMLPASLDFGVWSGAAVQREVRIENVGAGTVSFVGAGAQILGAGSSVFGFSGTPDTSPIPPSGIRTFTVVFDALGADLGQQDGKMDLGAAAASAQSADGSVVAALLLITTDDPALPRIALPLTAEQPPAARVGSRWEIYD